MPVVLNVYSFICLFDNFIIILLHCLWMWFPVVNHNVVFIIFLFLLDFLVFLLYHFFVCLFSAIELEFSFSVVGDCFLFFLYRIKIVVIHNGYVCIWNSSSSSHWHRLVAIVYNLYANQWKQNTEKYNFYKLFSFLFVYVCMCCFYFCFFLILRLIVSSFVFSSICSTSFKNKPHSTEPHNSIEMT